MFFFRRQLSESIHVHPKFALISELLSLLWPCGQILLNHHTGAEHSSGFAIYSKVCNYFLVWPNGKHCTHSVMTPVHIRRHIELYVRCVLQFCVLSYRSVKGWFSMCNKGSTWVNAAQTITHAITSYINIDKTERERHSPSRMNTYLFGAHWINQLADK